MLNKVLFGTAVVAALGVGALSTQKYNDQQHQQEVSAAETERVQAEQAQAYQTILRQQQANRDCEIAMNYYNSLTDEQKELIDTPPCFNLQP